VLGVWGAKTIECSPHLLLQVVVAVRDGHILHHVTGMKDVAACGGHTDLQHRTTITTITTTGAAAAGCCCHVKLHAVQQLSDCCCVEVQPQAVVDVGQRHLQLMRGQVRVH